MYTVVLEEQMRYALVSDDGNHMTVFCRSPQMTWVFMSNDWS